jgi:Flp pilus assembly protein CpaB
MRGKYIVLSLIFTIILFSMLIYTENKVLGNGYKQDVLIVKHELNIDRFEKLDATMFEKKTVVTPSSVANSLVSDLSEIEGKYALSDLSSDELVRKDKIGNKSKVSIVDVDSDKRKLAIPVSSLADAVSGQIRKNSLVDILFTNTPTTDDPNIKTETLLQNIKVIGVTDSNGVELDNSNGGQIASVLVAVSPQDAHLIVNKERKGKFRLIGVPENAKTYDKVIVK